MVYGAKDSALQQRYKNILEELSLKEVTKSWRSAKVSFANVDEVTEESLSSSIVYLVGAVDENPLIKKYLVDTPFQISSSEIQIGAKQVPNNNAILGVCFYPSPADQKVPFSFLTGTSATEVYDLFAEKVSEMGQP